ncbi:MAG: hypothetical protein JW993_02210 [Sedimentisphaerales bacterium]|nr:hypothetical protein [Sedimentisphaerales bacterium]
MAVTGVLIWIASGVLAYFITEAAALCCGRRAWDKATREFALVCSMLLGPIYLLIAAELLLLAAIGNGLTTDHTRRHKDS